MFPNIYRISDTIQLHDSTEYLIMACHQIFNIDFAILLSLSQAQSDMM